MADPDNTPDETQKPGMDASSADESAATGGSSKPASAVPSDDKPSSEPEADSPADDDGEEEVYTGHVEPLEFIDESAEEENQDRQWYILKIAVNREDSIRDALIRRVKREGLDRYFGEIVIPTEDVVEFTKNQKRKVVKKKLYPGYLLINMHVNDATWFVVRETPGIGDFTTSGGKPAPMAQKDVDKILRSSKPAQAEEPGAVKMAIPFKKGDRVRVKEGYFQNSEGDVEAIDESNGRVTVLLTIFGRPTPVQIDHWHVESV